MFHISPSNFLSGMILGKTKKPAKTPVKLERDTIMECVAEVWFNTAVPAAGDLLPGALFQDFKNEFPNLTRLPLADVPRQIRQVNQGLARQPLFALEGDKRKIVIGDSVLSVSFQAPYPGWKDARPLVIKVIERLVKSGMAGDLERASIKYINFLVADETADQLDLIEINVDLAGYDLRGPGRFVRAEIDVDTYIAIVDIQTGNRFTIENVETPGLMCAIDVVSTPGTGVTWEKFPGTLDRLHEIEKEVFFRLLKESTLKGLGPIWERAI